ncbi:32052_t:CDS:2, partial [Gigaspora margarita]
QLSKMAKVINTRKADNVFENAFVIQYKFTYANKDHLTLLTKKAEVFLLRVFEDIYQKLGQSSIKHMKNNKYTFQLVSLNFAMDQKQMPLGFSSDYFPSSNACDYCYKQFDETSKGFMNRFEANKTNNLESRILDENNILKKLEKNKDALPLVEQAYVIARERFLSL